MQEQGFFASLFDTSFSSFITTKIIKVLYILTMVLLGLVALGFVVSAFTVSTGFGLLTLVILAPLMFLLYLIYARVVLELFIAIFRIMETNFELVALSRQGSATPPAAPEAPTSPFTPPPA